MINSADVLAILDATKALGDVIRAETKHSPLGGIPAGHLYARLMGVIDLDKLEMLLKLLVTAGVVRREPSHLLVWIGPDKT